MTVQITNIEQAHSVIQEVYEAFYNIPFDNSDYQVKTFVLAAQQTPGRAYRALGLQLTSKLNAVQELRYQRQLEEVDIDEYQATIESATTSEFDKRRAAIKIQQLRSKTQFTDKLLNDAIHELNLLYSQFQLYPKYTRDQFEAEEEEHFTKLFELQLTSGGNGTVQSQCAQQLEKEWNANYLLTGDQNAN